MGMASSDDESSIARAYQRQQHLKHLPTRPGSWDHPPTEESMAHYTSQLVQWADGFPVENAWPNDSR